METITKLTEDVVAMLFDLMTNIYSGKGFTGSSGAVSTDLVKKALVQLVALEHSFEQDAKTAPEFNLNKVTRTCYLSFTEHSKTIAISMKKPSAGSGRVSVEVTINIPKSLFHSTKMKATVNLPNGGLSQEALVDVKQALTMAYGNHVELIVQAAEKSVV